jgi:hypothetical protein
MCLSTSTVLRNQLKNQLASHGIEGEFNSRKLCLTLYEHPHSALEKFFQTEQMIVLVQMTCFDE